MASLPEKLHNDVVAVCPLTGISLGDETDKSTWRVNFKPEATDQQKADAQAVIDAFDIAAWEEAQASEAQRQAGVKASAYVTQWDDALKRKTVTQIKALFDGATAQQKSDLLFYLLLVRALEVKD